MRTCGSAELCADGDLSAVDEVSVSSMSPVSNPSAMYIEVTPVTVSPSMTARCIGAAPRYFGRSEP